MSSVWNARINMFDRLETSRVRGVAATVSIHAIEHGKPEYASTNIASQAATANRSLWVYSNRPDARGHTLPGSLEVQL